MTAPGPPGVPKDFKTGFVKATSAQLIWQVRGGVLVGNVSLPFAILSQCWGKARGGERVGKPGDYSHIQGAGFSPQKVDFFSCNSHCADFKGVLTLAPRGQCMLAPHTFSIRGLGENSCNQYLTLFPAEIPILTCGTKHINTSLSFPSLSFHLAPSLLCTHRCLSVMARQWRATMCSGILRATAAGWRGPVP